MIRKYLALYAAFWRASFTADLEFRLNFSMRVFTDVFWYVSQVVSFEVLFLHTSEIGGWTRDDMRVFLGILFLVDGLYMVVFSANLDFFSETVRKGSLDLLLAKPVSSQFMISLQRVSTANIANLPMAVGWLGWSLYQLPAFDWWRLFWLVIAVPCGALIFYSFRFVFSATAVVFTRVENLNYLWYNFYRLGMRPDSIYVPWLKYLLLTALPIGLIASVPARLVLGFAHSSLALWLVAVAAISVYFSHRFWQVTLRRYTSASS